MHNPLDPHDSSTDTTPGSYLHEIAALRATIVLMQEEKRLLQGQLGFGSRKLAIMQAALTQCRMVIEDYQNEPKIEGCPSRGKNVSANFRWAPFKKSAHSALAFWGLPKKSDIPRYIARSDLETMILRTAATRVGGILGVIIEVKQAVDPGQGANWRITGIISGKADRSVASEAVTRAAMQYANWIAVDDGSHLNGRAIAEVVGCGQPFAETPAPLA